VLADRLDRTSQNLHEVLAAEDLTDEVFPVFEEE